MNILTVVLTTYNIEKYIEQTLDSILRQSYKDLEVIIVDDASSDSTLAILEQKASQDNRIKIFPLEKNIGPGATRNFGLHQATGHYVTFVDHDDWQNLNRYENMVKIMKEHNSKVCFSYANDYDENTGKTKERRSLKLSSGSYDMASHKKKIAFTLFPPWSKVYCRSFLINNNIKFAEGDVFFDDVLFHSHLYFLVDEFTVYAEHDYTHRVFNSSITKRHHGPDRLYQDYMECFIQCLRNVDSRDVSKHQIADYYYQLLRKYPDKINEINDIKISKLIKIQKIKYKILEGLRRRIAYFF